MVKRHINPVWAAILVLVTIWALFYFSGQSGETSNAVSGGLTDTLLSMLRLELTTEQSKILHYFVRKGAHFGLFFLLGVGLMALFYKYSVGRGIVLTTALSVATAAANEFHQLLGGTRTASMKDVWLDSTGAVVGCLLYCVVHGWMLVQRERKRRNDTKN